MGYSAAYYDGLWHANLDKLKAFEKKHGHCIVPRSTPGLGKWVHHQRTSYREGTLSDERFQQLEELDFCWSPHVEAWQTNVNKLKAFKKKHGHCRVPDSNSVLGKWVRQQRFNAKNGTLSKKRKDTLNELGFCWSTRDEDWQSKFALLQQYKQQNGHCQVPLSDRKLGCWVNDQRIARKKGNMREERFQQLEEIEFVWDAKKLAARAKPSAAEISSDEEAEGEEPDAAGPMPPRLLGASQADRSNKRAVKKRHAAEEEEDRSLPDDAEEEDSDEEPSSYGIATRAKKRAANGTCVKPSKVVAAETQPEREEHKEDEEVATDNVAPPFENHIAPELFVSEPNLVKPKGPSYIQLQEEKLHHYNERQSSRKKRRRRNERNDSGHEGEDREEEASQIQLLRELVAAQRELIEEKSNSAALQKKVTQLQERENRRLQKKLGRQKMAESDDDEEEEASDSKEDSDGDDESTSRPNAKKHPKSLKKLIFALEQSRKNKRSTIKLEEDTFHD